jgi:transposase
MIERHWDGIAAYCKPENKVSRAYGYRDEGYLKPKIISAFLPPLPRGVSRGPL